MEECSREMYVGELLEDLAYQFPQIRENDSFKVLQRSFDHNQTTTNNVLKQSPSSMVRSLIELELYNKRRNK